MAKDSNETGTARVDRRDVVILHELAMDRVR
jgi:hypothetical protein